MFNPGALNDLPRRMDCNYTCSLKHLSRVFEVLPSTLNFFIRDDVINIEALLKVCSLELLCRARSSASLRLEEQ